MPNVLIMRAMGWTGLAQFALLGLWTLISTALIILIPERHRRPELRPRTIIGPLVAWVALGAIVLGTGWDMRTVLACLLILPGLNYLLLEGIGLTPKPKRRSASLP